MKKKLLSVILCTALVVSLFTGCGSAEEERASETVATEETSGEGGLDVSGKTIAMVTKVGGNPFMEKFGEGFTEVVEANGGVALVIHPEAGTAGAQISAIQSLISQRVDAITVTANDENALQAALQEAMDAGIAVSCFDSRVNADSRATFVNQATNAVIGETLIEAVYEIAGGEGQYAILSATSQAANQNAWIEAMKEAAVADPKYANLELVDIVYGDDEPQKSTDQTQALLQKYPDLKVICSPTTVGIAAAAKVLQDSDTTVKLTGLGMASDLAEYIGDDDEHSVPSAYIWSPFDLGGLAAYTSIALLNGEITGEVGETFVAGSLGEYTLTDAGDGGSEIILGPLLKFDSSNINEGRK